MPSEPIFRDWSSATEADTDEGINALLGRRDRDCTRTEAAEFAAVVRAYLVEKVYPECQKRLKGSNLVHYLRIVAQALLTGENLLVVGPAGTGKTVLAETMAEVMNLPAAYIMGNSETSDQDLIGIQTWANGQWRFEPGFLLIKALLLIFDEIFRTPASAQTPLLEALATRRLSVPDLGGKGRRTAFLPWHGSVFMAANPVTHAGAGQRVEAVIDRATMGYWQYQPEAVAQVAMLAAEISGQRAKLVPQPLPLTFAEIRAALRHVNVDEALLKVIVNISWLVSSPSFRRLSRFEQAYFTCPDRRTQARLRRLEELTESSLLEGGNPRGCFAILANARGRALLDGRLTVTFDDIRFAAQVGLCQRLKPLPGADEAIPAILEEALDLVLPEGVTR